MRYFTWIAGFAAVSAAAGQLWAASTDEIISEAAAQRCGLTRAWVTQAQVDPAQGRLQSLVLYDGTLFAQSNRATLEAIDAETGQRIWSKLIGQANYPSLRPPSAAIWRPSSMDRRLYVLNRYTGDILFETTVNGVPGGSPALSTQRAYVPMASGLIYSYRLEPDTRPGQGIGQDQSEPGHHERRRTKGSRQESRGRPPREHPLAPGIRSALGLRIGWPGDDAADNHHAKPR